MTNQVLAIALEDIYAPGKAMGGDTASIGKLATPLISNIIVISGTFAFFVIIFAGFSYITANGDKSKIEQAQNMLNYGIVGLLLVAVSFIITRIIGTLFGITFF